MSDTTATTHAAALPPAPRPSIRFEEVLTAIRLHPLWRARRSAFSNRVIFIRPAVAAVPPSPATLPDAESGKAGVDAFPGSPAQPARLLTADLLDLSPRAAREWQPNNADLMAEDWEILTSPMGGQ